MGRMVRCVPSTLLVIGFLTSFGCGGSGGGSGPPPPPPPDFALSLSPNAVTVPQGQTSSPLTLSVVGQNGFAGAVSITLTGLPAGVTSSPSGAFNVNAGSGVSVTLTAPSNAPIGSFPVSATGSSIGLSRSANLNLTVQSVLNQASTKTIYKRTDSIPALDESPGEAHHRHIAYDAANKNLFVANRAMNRVEVFSATDGSSRCQLDVPGASSADISADGATIWIGTAVEQIIAVDASSRQIKARFSVSGLTPLPGSIFDRPTEVLSLSGGKALVRLREPARPLSLLALWDPRSNAWTNLTSAAPQLFQNGLGVFARSGDHGRVLVAANDASGEVALFDATGKVVVGPQILGGGTISSVAVNRDASRSAVFFTLNGNSQILLLDAALNQIAARAVTSVRGIAFSPDGSTLYVNENSPALQVIDALDGHDLHLLGRVSDILVQGVGTGLEEASETKLLFGLANRGVSFLDASNPSALSAAPPVFSVAPAALPSTGGNAGGTAVTLSGQNFSAGAQILFGALTSTTVTVSNPTQIIANSPASAATGPVNITALFPSGWISLAPDAFSYGPHISQILPNAVNSAGGDSIQIYGYGFGDDPAKITVTIGGQTASLQKMEGTSAIAPSLGLDAKYPFPLQRLIVLTPRGAPGDQDVAVISPSGSTTISSAFQLLRDVAAYPNSGLHKFVVYDQKRQRLYLSSTDHIDVFDLRLKSFLAAIQPPGGPPPNAGLRGLSLTPDLSQLIAADFGPQKIYLINPDSALGTIVPVGGVPGFLNSGPARVAATSMQTVFVGMSGEGSTTGACSNCLGQLNLLSSPPVIQPATQPEITMLTGAPLVSSNAAGDRAFLTFGSAPGAPLAAWAAAAPNSFATSSANASATDLAVAGDGTFFSTLGGDLAEIRAADLSLSATSATAELERVRGRTVVPGAVLDPSGALLYQPFLDGPAPPAFPANGLHGGIDILSARTGRLRLRIFLSEPLAMLSSDSDGLHGAFLSIDENGEKIFALTASGLTVVQLATVPLELGSISPSLVPAAGGALIKIRGSGFQAGCTATLGGKSANVSFVDVNTLNVTVPALSAGPQQLIVTNPGGKSVVWDAALFTN